MLYCDWLYIINRLAVPGKKYSGKANVISSNNTTVKSNKIMQFSETQEEFSGQQVTDEEFEVTRHQRWNRARRFLWERLSYRRVTLPVTYSLVFHFTRCFFPPLRGHSTLMRWTQVKAVIDVLNLYWLEEESWGARWEEAGLFSVNVFSLILYTFLVFPLDSCGFSFSFPRPLSSLAHPPPLADCQHLSPSLPLES